MNKEIDVACKHDFVQVTADYYYYDQPSYSSFSSLDKPATFTQKRKTATLSLCRYCGRTFGEIGAWEAYNKLKNKFDELCDVAKQLADRMNTEGLMLDNDANRIEVRNTGFLLSREARTGHEKLVELKGGCER